MDVTKVVVGGHDFLLTNGELADVVEGVGRNAHDIHFEVVHTVVFDGGVAKFVFKRVDEVNVGEAFGGDSFKSGVNFEAGWRKGVVRAVGIVKHGTDGIGESIGREANEDEANA